MRLTTHVLAGILLLVAATPGVAQLSRSIVFEDTPGTQTLHHEGVEVIVQPDPVEGDPNSIQTSYAIRVPGYSPLILRDNPPVSGFHPRWVGIGRLSRSDPAPSVLLGGFTGGAHCCATLRAIIPDNGRLRVVDLPARDGGTEDTFPQDIDDDGVVDFILQDDRFRYQFASGAGSWSPPVIYNIYRGNLIDVTTQPGYRPLWEEFAREARSACSDRTNEDRNGACAAYVAAAARLGRYAEAIREVEPIASRSTTFLPTACRVPEVNFECPQGQQITFGWFVPALTWFLRTNGYID